MDYSKLIKKCLDGDSRAQHEMFEAFSPKMYYVCLRYAASDEEARDMLQEGFIRMFSKLGSYSGKGSFEGWARRVFVNTAIKYYHKMRKHNSTDTLDTVATKKVKATAISELSEKELMKLIRDLPDGYRHVFNMYAIEGYSHKEIAEQMGIEESTSRSQLVKARRLLQVKVMNLQKIMV